jgi:hypothetical protein
VFVVELGERGKELFDPFLLAEKIRYLESALIVEPINDDSRVPNQQKNVDI